MMDKMTTEQVEQKKQQLKQLVAQAQKLKDELVEAGAWPLDDDELDEAAGGWFPSGNGRKNPDKNTDNPFV